MNIANINNTYPITNNILNSKSTTVMQNNTNQTRSSNDTVTISDAGKLASIADTLLSTSESTFKDRMFKAVDNDSNFAKKMVNDFGFSTDQMAFALPSNPNDESAWAKIRQAEYEFNQQAAQVCTERSEMCNKLKEKGTSDSDIFKAIINFNQNLPANYRNQCGMTGELYS